MAAVAAVSDCGIKPLQHAMKLANVALELDTDNRAQEAYCEYLKTIKYISLTLLEDAESKGENEVVTLDTQKMLKLAEQCLERAKSTASRLEAGFQGKVEARSLVMETAKSTHRHTHRRVQSDGGQQTALFLPPELFQKMQIAEIHNAKKELTPLEEASRQNEKLKAAYEARMARLAPSQAMQKTSLTLSLQRQMMENIVIAKARQETLQRKMEERRLRLQEEANRRFSSRSLLTPEEQEQSTLYARMLEYEQDHAWVKDWKNALKKNPNDTALVGGLMSHLLSCADQPITQLLKKLQYGIYNRLYPLVSKGNSNPWTDGSEDAQSRSNQPTCRLKSSKSFHGMSSVLEKNKVNAQMMRHSATMMPLIEDLNANTTAKEVCSRGQDFLGHPLIQDTAGSLDMNREESFEDLENYLIKSNCPLASAALQPQFEDLSIPFTEGQVFQENLRSTVREVHNALDKLLSLCILAFEPLNTVSAKDHCMVCIEEAFFPPIWPLLITLFRRVYADKEAALSRTMKIYRNAGPSDMGVSSDLFPAKSESVTGSYPYEAAVQELRLITKEYSPQKKLDCIVRALRVICDCADTYCPRKQSGGHHGNAAIGADDLLPILSYVALKSDLPPLVSECAALEDFIHEGYLIGEEGYCLTSLQSAIAYLEALPTEHH
ncbi:VPS9 domain-containing protein 1 [Protopterus annectens]|uniref:VPS9 domain-containing protein 1 n=1 Tax=Protopterus annectens TaxID=7888 RepID=UPI001CFA50D4|nr:VPS9 domain-containing protein 1 [Protopterus annectens]